MRRGELGMPMKAMLLETTEPVEAQPLVLSEVETPSPGPGQIRVAVRVCGVCHTDLHTVEGELAPRPLPIVPGHQVIGVVDALGKGAARLPAGRRVGVAWLHRTCRTCAFCQRGDENLCPAGEFTGYDAHGGYAEYLVIDEDYAYELPGGFPDEQAAPLMCAGIIGYRAFRLADVGSGGRLGLYGFGGSAHVTIQLARYLGCRVFVFSRSATHRALAMELGAEWSGLAQDEPPERLDGSIIFAPAGNLVPLAMEHLDRGGTCALAGIHMSQIPPLEYERHLYYEKVLRSVTASTRADGVELLRLAADAGIRTRVTMFPLAQANRALGLLKDGKIDGAAVLHVRD